MSYTDLLEDENIETNYLCILRPRRRVLTWTVVTGTIYSAPFNYGEVVSADNNGLPLTLAASVSVGSDEFFYDVDTETLYVDIGVDPDTVWLTVEYELYFATYDGHHYRVPDDNTTRQVYFEPLITEAPALKQNISESISGINPVYNLNMGLNNSDHFFDRHLHDSSFNDARIEIWHWLDELTVDNVSLVLNGSVKNVSLAQPSVTITMADRTDFLKNEWRHPSPQESFFSTSLFPDLDETYNGRPIRMIYGGPVDGHIPVNVSFNDDEPTTSDNRAWVTNTGQSNQPNLTFTVDASPASTATRTYITTAPDGVNVGDSIWLDKASDEYALVTAVGANFIDHTTIVTPASGGELVKRAFIGSVTIIQNNIEYTALYKRDYDITNFAGTSAGFTFDTNLESNLSMPNTLQIGDLVFCRVYGPTNFVTLGGPSFGTNDTRTANMNHPVQVILDILKRHVGIDESDLDTDSFNYALSAVPYGVSVVMPPSSYDDFSVYLDIISTIARTALIRLLIDPNGRFSLGVYEPMGSSDKTIADDEILSESISFDYNNDEIVSDVIVEYNPREASNSPGGSEQVSTVTATSDIAVYLHKASKTRTDQSLWTFAVDAQEYADHLAFIFGDRKGIVTLGTRNRFFNTTLGDIITVQRPYLPGNDVDGSTVFTRKYRVVNIDKGSDKVTLDLDDQKNVEDNAGGW